MGDSLLRLFGILALAVGTLVAIFLFAPWGQSSDSLHVHRARDVVYFEWDGDIEPPMARALAAAWRQQEPAATIVLTINSPGGSVDEGDDVIRWLQRLHGKTNVITHVGPQAYCASMCVPIYLAGEQRSAAATSTFMFHHAYSVDRITGERTFVFSGDEQLMARQVFHQFLRKSKMDESWGQGLEAAIRDGGEVRKSGRELKRERSNIVLTVHDDPRP